MDSRVTKFCLGQSSFFCLGEINVCDDKLLAELIFGTGDHVAVWSVDCGKAATMCYLKVSECRRGVLALTTPKGVRPRSLAVILMISFPFPSSFITAVQTITNA